MFELVLLFSVGEREEYQARNGNTVGSGGAI